MFKTPPSSKNPAQNPIPNKIPTTFKFSSSKKPKQDQLQVENAEKNINPLLTNISKKVRDQIPRVVKKQYRNGSYVGGIANNNYKQGLGLLIIDTGEVIFGNWQQDRVCGQCLYISNQLRFFGRVDTNGYLQGFHMIRIIDTSVIDHTQFQNQQINQHTNPDPINQNQIIQPLTLYATFKNNKIFGKCVIVIKQYIYICSVRLAQSMIITPPSTSILKQQKLIPKQQQKIRDQNLQILQKIRNKNKNQLPTILRTIFPYIKIFQFQQYTKNLIQKNYPNSNYFGNYLFTNNQSKNVEEFISKSNPNININNTKDKYFQQYLSKYIPSMYRYPANNNNSDTSKNDYKIFYGFSTRKFKNTLAQRSDKSALHICGEQFGFMLYNEELVSIGEHSDGIPHGLACVYQYPYFVHDGQHKYGKPEGFGVRMDISSGLNRYTYGKFQKKTSYNQLNNYQTTGSSSRKSSMTKYKSIKQTISTQNTTIPIQIYKQGVNWPMQTVRELKKQLHIKSIYYDPSYAQIGVYLPLRQVYRLCSQITNNDKDYQQSSFQQSQDNYDSFSNNFSHYNNKLGIPVVTNSAAKRRYTEISGYASVSASPYIQSFRQNREKQQANKQELIQQPKRRFKTNPAQSINTQYSSQNITTPMKNPKIQDLLKGSPNSNSKSPILYESKTKNNQEISEKIKIKLKMVQSKQSTPLYYQYISKNNEEQANRSEKNKKNQFYTDKDRDYISDYITIKPRVKSKSKSREYIKQRSAEREAQKFIKKNRKVQFQYKYQTNSSTNQPNFPHSTRNKNRQHRSNTLYGLLHSHNK